MKMFSNRSSLFLFLLCPSFRCTLFLTLLVFKRSALLGKENFTVRNAPKATDASFVLLAGYSLLYRVVRLRLRQNTLFLRNNSPLAIWLAPLLSSCHWQLRFSPVSCFVFGFGTGYCGFALRLQKSHRFFWIFGGMANPLQRIYNEYEIQIGAESVSISVLFRWTIASALAHNDIGTLSLCFGN